MTRSGQSVTFNLPHHSCQFSRRSSEPPLSVCQLTYSLVILLLLLPRHVSHPMDNSKAHINKRTHDNANTKIH